MLTEAARRGGDFAEFVTLAVAGAAANVGGIEAVLAGRPGSWEAEKVRDMLYSTVGYDEAHLLEHRTERLIVRVHVDDTLIDLGIADLYYIDAEVELCRRVEAIWADADRHTRDGLEFVHLSAEQHTAIEELDALQEQLDDLRRTEWAAYGEAFRQNVLRAADEMLPRLPVTVEVVVSLDWQGDQGSGDDLTGPAVRLWEWARAETPLPGSGVPLKDYPLDRDVAQVEHDAGRLPLTRVQRNEAGGTR